MTRIFRPEYFPHSGRPDLCIFALAIKYGVEMPALLTLHLSDFGFAVVAL